MSYPFPEEFTDGFPGWISGGYSVLVSDDRLVVANGGGEIRDQIAWADGRYVLTHAERAEDEVFALETASLADIERYLTVQIGRELRNDAGMPRIRIPFGAADAASGFAVDALPDGRWGVRRGSRNEGEVRFRDAYSAAQFTHYADADLAELRSSLERTDGAPLFTRFVVGDVR